MWHQVTICFCFTFAVGMNMLVHIYYVFFNFRMGEPDECGGIVSFLCSDDASYITGETVVVSGGMLSRL